MQEGPHSTLPEDEFFDAVETGLDKIEEDRQLRVRLKLQSQQVIYLYYYFYIISFIDSNYKFIQLRYYGKDVNVSDLFSDVMSIVFDKALCQQ